jgi:transposase-like protein
VARRRDVHQVGGRWTYLYRAVDKQGLTVDFWRKGMRVRVPQIWDAVTAT